MKRIVGAKCRKMEEKKRSRIELLKHPEWIGRAVGFPDLTEMHGEWIREMVFGREDYTLQAHRGSYKSSCLAVAIALMMVLYPTRNIIFLRKTDDDVAEMMRMVSKMLKSEVFAGLVGSIYGTELMVTAETTEQISTNLWVSPMGAPQLLGLGIRGSITGKHAWFVITDDICNKDDRASRAERERTKTQYDELQNIRNRGGRIINLGTPWHRDDVFTKMPNIHRYDCYVTGLISAEKLQEIRASMPSFLFAANYELKHIASSDAIFTTAPQFTDEVEGIYDGYCHIDAAYGGGDFTAMTCANRLDDGTIVMYGRIWKKDVLSVLPEILREAARLRCGNVYCEENGDKGFLKREIWELSEKMESEATIYNECTFPGGGTDGTVLRSCEARQIEPSPGPTARNARVNKTEEPSLCLAGLIWPHTYTERQNKTLKIETYLRGAWEQILFLAGTDREYIDQILDYTEFAEHDDAPDSAATVCRFFATYRW